MPFRFSQSLPCDPRASVGYVDSKGFIKFMVNLGSPWVERSDNETKIQKIERLESFLHYIYIENIFASDPLHFFPRAKIIWWYIWRKGPFLNLILSHMQGRKGPFVSHNVLFLYNHTLWGNRAHGEETEQGVTERSDRTHLPPYPFRSLRPRGRRKGSVRREMGPNPLSPGFLLHFTSVSRLLVLVRHGHRLLGPSPSDLFLIIQSERSEHTRSLTGGTEVERDEHTGSSFMTNQGITELISPPHLGPEGSEPEGWAKMRDELSLGRLRFAAPIGITPPERDLSLPSDSHAGTPDLQKLWRII